MIHPKTGKIVKAFDCIANANRYLKLSKTNKMINRICKGVALKNIYHGYKWRYTKPDEDIFNITNKELSLVEV